MQQIGSFDGLKVELVDGVIVITQHKSYSKQEIIFPVEMWGWVRGSVEAELALEIHREST